ncbi:peptidase inhibitor family I36 protein [Streptomyces sp. NBC_01198]|uniref:peptidase inhibitor family I36 protein n=1 Tax=Streptomyces sp. NBC_01198 TaxID=2903769 RepID=UPI002E0E0DB6|nr:peptidase inhibitor family I36 protein [Streptomyces sp. NBC_01198]
MRKIAVLAAALVAGAYNAQSAVNHTPYQATVYTGKQCTGSSDGLAPGAARSLAATWDHNASVCLT